MKLKALLAACAVAGLSASLALATPPPTKNSQTGTDTTTTTTTAKKGKPAKTGPNCRPKIAVILKGTLAGDGAAAPSTLLVTVTHTNRPGKAFKAAQQPVSVSVTAATKVSRRGDHDPAHLKTGDRVKIYARVCKADLAHAATPALTAARIAASPAASTSG